jgi:hypothetical protein
MLATGGAATVTVVDPDTVPDVAVIVELPGATAVISPADETVATPVALELHESARPARTFPFASFTVAVSGIVAPTITVAVDGATVTLAAGTALTVTVAVAAWPSLIAVITDAPGATAVTTPAADTVATVVVAELQVTTRPVSA